MNQENVTALGEPGAATARFRTLFPSTPRGAHTARHAAERWLAEHLGQRGTRDDGTATVSLVVGELTANAARHGRVPGRHARLVLTVTPAAVRVEVTDARGECPPVPAGETGAVGESGRGLLLVAALTDAWGCEPYPPGGKTVWAECARQPRTVA